MTSPSPIQKIVWNYQQMTGLKLKGFGAAFGVCHGTIINWRDGQTEPETDFLIQFRDYPDWRGQFARECLRARHPKKYLG